MPDTRQPGTWRHQTLTAVAACLSLAAASGSGEDWPHLRGPQYDAVCRDTSLDLAQIRAGPPLLWKQKLGTGYSGFTVADRRAFTQFQTRAGQFVTCLNLETGAVLWQTRYGWPWGTLGQYPGTYGTPTLRQNRVFFSDCYGAIGCLDAATGHPLWRTDLVQTFGIKVPGFGYACTPLVLDGKVFVPVGDKPSAATLRAADGAVL